MEDTRQAAQVPYPSPEIAPPPRATLARADDFVEAQLRGGQNLAFLRRLLPDACGVPSQDTPGDVVALLDPAPFKERFISWIAGSRAAIPDPADPEVVAVDGGLRAAARPARRGASRCTCSRPL